MFKHSKPCSDHCTVGFSWSHKGIFSEASFKFCLQFPQSLWHISVSDRTICPHHNIAWHPHTEYHTEYPYSGKVSSFAPEKLLKLISHKLIMTGTPFTSTEDSSDHLYWPKPNPFTNPMTQVVNYFYRTRVRSLVMLVSDSLPHWLTPVQ